MSFCYGFTKTAGDVIHMSEWLKKHPTYRIEKKIQKMHQAAAPRVKSLGSKLKKAAPYIGLAGLGALAYYGSKEDRPAKKGK